MDIFETWEKNTNKVRGVSLDAIGVFIKLDQGRSNKSRIICSAGFDVL